MENQGDLIFIEMDSLNMNPIYEIYVSIVYSMRPDNIFRIMVAGKHSYITTKY